MAAPPLPPDPMQPVLDRRPFEAQYVRDALFLANGGTCRVSSQSLQSLFDGLSWCIGQLRALGPALPVTTGGQPAQPAAGGS